MDNDSVRLLRECNVGIKMGVSSIDEILENVSDSKMKQILKEDRKSVV